MWKMFVNVGDLEIGKEDFDELMHGKSKVLFESNLT